MTAHFLDKDLLISEYFIISVRFISSWKRFFPNWFHLPEKMNFQNCCRSRCVGKTSFGTESLNSTLRPLLFYVKGKKKTANLDKTVEYHKLFHV